MDISILFIVKTIVVGLCIGITIGMTGIGGGALIQPALIFIIGLSPVTAIGTGLAYALITKMGGTISHFRLKTIRYRRVAFFLVGSIPGVLFASRVVNNLVSNYNPDQVNSLLQILIGAVLIMTAIVLCIGCLKKDDDERQQQIADSTSRPFPFNKKIVAMGTGMLIGVLIGATSVGGGVLIIPIFLIFLDANTKQAVGSSIVISLCLAALGGAVYFFSGNVNVIIALLLCIGSLPGVNIGSRLSVIIPERVLKAIVTVIVGLSGLSMIFGISHH